MKLTGREKATILLSLLGSELSSTLIRNLPEEMADMIAQGINHLPNPSAEVISSVLDEFMSFMALPSAATKKVLQDNFSIMPQEAEPAPKPVAVPEERKGPSDILFYSHPKKVAMALSAERAPVVAYVLSLMPSVQSREVLSFMPERHKELDTILRTIKKPPISSDLKDPVVKIIADRIQRLVPEQ